MSELSRLRGSEGYKVRDDEGALTDFEKPFRRTARMVEAIYGA